ncbi:MAG: zinc-ribbon domain-containing protein [Asgard group archaeon]|nr:zinc-ribbon domain-containing protein [Asgard group archaeon]
MSVRRAYIGSRILLFIFGIPMTIYGLLVIFISIFTSTELWATISIGLVGFILLASGIASVLSVRLNRAKILGALKSYERVSLEQLSSELKFTKNKTKREIVHLRAEGRLKASFDPDTGDILVIEVDGLPPEIFDPLTADKEEFKDKLKPSDLNYCTHCGSIVKPDNQFCNNCGSYLS